MSINDITIDYNDQLFDLPKKVNRTSNNSIKSSEKITKIFNDVKKITNSVNKSTKPLSKSTDDVHKYLEWCLLSIEFFHDFGKYKTFKELKMHKHMKEFIGFSVQIDSQSILNNLKTDIKNNVSDKIKITTNKINDIYLTRDASACSRSLLPFKNTNGVGDYIDEGNSVNKHEHESWINQLLLGKKEYFYKPSDFGNIFNKIKDRTFETDQKNLSILQKFIYHFIFSNKTKLNKDHFSNIKEIQRFKDDYENNKQVVGEFNESELLKFITTKPDIFNTLTKTILKDGTSFETIPTYIYINNSSKPNTLNLYEKEDVIKKNITINYNSKIFGKISQNIGIISDNNSGKGKIKDALISYKVSTIIYTFINNVNNGLLQLVFEDKSIKYKFNNDTLPKTSYHHIHYSNMNIVPSKFDDVSEKILKKCPPLTNKPYVLLQLMYLKHIGDFSQICETLYEIKNDTIKYNLTSHTTIDTYSLLFAYFYSDENTGSIKDPQQNSSELILKKNFRNYIIPCRNTLSIRQSSDMKFGTTNNSMETMSISPRNGSENSTIDSSHNDRKPTQAWMQNNINPHQDKKPTKASLKQTQKLKKTLQIRLKLAKKLLDKSRRTLAVENRRKTSETSKNINVDNTPTNAKTRLLLSFINLSLYSSSLENSEDIQDLIYTNIEAVLLNNTKQITKENIDKLKSMFKSDNDLSQPDIEMFENSNRSQFGLSNTYDKVNILKQIETLLTQLINYK
jgi:hypothetical protein